MQEKTEKRYELINSSVLTISEDASNKPQSYRPSWTMECNSVNDECTSDSPPRLTPNLSKTNLNLVPREGEFFIDIIIQNTATNCSNGVAKEHYPNLLNDEVAIKLSCFTHTSRGAAIVNMIKSQIKPEIQRSNRRWRRIKERSTT